MSGKHPLVQAVENAQLKQDIPAFAPGDTVVVQVKVKKATVNVYKRSKALSLLRKPWSELCVHST